ncbi:MAG: indole-3-glycerol phosphate synthase TrpC [Chloroflexi bacterium]|nr:indole-3-glycerol phosphate synthase TrpC [Chloroflexota bacterium]
MILDEILAHKRQQVAAQRQARSLDEVQRAAERAAAPRGFRAALLQPGLSVIAEVKRRSPSRGVLRQEVDPAELAALYAREGARAISVLTDERFFGGSNADLEAIRARGSTPLLRKDFVVDAYQVWEARAIGADAVLLIVRALDQTALRDLLRLARALGLDALVEVHDEAELARALEASADLVGINNRDLSAMAVDLSTTSRLRPLVPPGVAVVSESGIRSAADLQPILACGVDAILVGEALMAAPEPGAALRALVQAGVAA